MAASVLVLVRLMSVPVIAKSIGPSERVDGMFLKAMR